MRLVAPTVRVVVAAVAAALCGCGTSAGVAPGAAPAPQTVLQSAPRATAQLETARVSTGFGLSGFGGYQGQHYYAHDSGHAFEYSESVALTFTQQLATSTFSYTIDPPAPSSVYFGNNYVRTATFTIRKVPGTVYTLTIPAGIKDQAGDVLAAPIVETFTTAAVPRAQAPQRRTLGEPYRYGVLEHPFSTSLGGSTQAQQIAAIANAGARFARIDYCGTQSEPTANTFDFKTEDSIAGALAARSITELPIVDQYCAPAWANGGSTASTPIWSTPALFAQFAAGVAAHMVAQNPLVTRMELFNEPNLGGWWNAPSPYDDPTGAATAAYMQAAYAAIKAVAPTMIVVGPALADGGTAVTDPRTFLTNMYAAGCRTGVCWDVLSVHDYAYMNPIFASEPDLPATYFNRFDVYKDLQAIAVANGEAKKPHVMLTEWGISTDPTSPSGFDPAVQAEYISIAFNKIDADSTVDGIVYTNIYNPGTDFFSMMALMDASFNPLPAYATYQTFAAK